MADGTYQLTGPSSASQARKVVYTAAAQQKGSWDSVSTFHTGFADENANILFQGGLDPTNTLSMTFVVAGNSTPLSVSVTSRAITVNVATDAGGLPISTANDVIAAVRASAPVQALKVAALPDYGSLGTGIVGAISTTSFAGATASTRGTASGAPLPHQHPSSNSYN